jgi:hypothetical protein
MVNCLVRNYGSEQLDIGMDKEFDADIKDGEIKFQEALLKPLFEHLLNEMDKLQR